MVERDNAAITVKRQADLLSVNRTSVHRPDKVHRESEENVQIMHRIDEIYMKHPYFGYRRMTWFLQEQGLEINRKRVRRLMKLMGLEAIYLKPNLSKRLYAQYTRPYLLRVLHD
ncbi:IS3 family transposase [Paenibacillus mendelii]|uniref:IS3 family transposase n=1 Tax=Paenibacillus mendelii TaxID=206163 RepID=A0ABV6J798_9BACL